MNKPENREIVYLAPKNDRVRKAGLLLLVCLFGLLLGTLIRPSEAAQNYEYRIGTLERRLDQMQFSFTQYDRRLNQLENQSLSPRPTTTATQPSASDVTGLAERESLTNRRIDELQSQLQIQNKMIIELHNIIEGKKPSKPEEKTDDKDKKDTTKKPALAGRPDPQK